ncbi:MAG: hypothetical protein FJ125_05090, partial [Deltaproteobacteria bacterium]|nr:hypothetical protein [Deltaproteobacteria bacterium]
MSMLSLAWPWPLLARAFGAILLPWAALGLRRGWPLATLLFILLVAAGAAVQPPPGPPPSFVALLLGEAALGLALGLVAALPLVVLLVAARLVGQGLPWMALSAARDAAPGLTMALLLLGVGLLFASGGHRPLLELWMEGAAVLPRAATAEAVPSLPQVRALAGALARWLVAGTVLALPLLLLEAAVRLLAESGRRLLGLAGAAAGSGVGLAVLLLGLACWLVLGLPGLGPL